MKGSSRTSERRDQRQAVKRLRLVTLGEGRDMPLRGLQVIGCVDDYEVIVLAKQVEPAIGADDPQDPWFDAGDCLATTRESQLREIARLDPELLHQLLFHANSTEPIGRPSLRQPLLDLRVETLDPARPIVDPAHDVGAIDVVIGDFFKDVRHRQPPIRRLGTIAPMYVIDMFESFVSNQCRSVDSCRRPPVCTPRALDRTARPRQQAFAVSRMPLYQSKTCRVRTPCFAMTSILRSRTR